MRYFEGKVLGGEMGKAAGATNTKSIAQTDVRRGRSVGRSVADRVNRDDESLRTGTGCTNRLAYKQHVASPGVE